MSDSTSHSSSVFRHRKLEIFTVWVADYFRQRPLYINVNGEAPRPGVGETIVKETFTVDDEGVAPGDEITTCPCMALRRAHQPQHPR